MAVSIKRVIYRRLYPLISTNFIPQLQKWITQGRVGRFSTSQAWSLENHQQHPLTLATERFWSEHTVPPLIFHGLSQLDINGTRIFTKAENIGKHQF